MLTVPGRTTRLDVSNIGRTLRGCADRARVRATPWGHALARVRCRQRSAPPTLELHLFKETPFACAAHATHAIHAQHDAAALASARASWVFFLALLTIAQFSNVTHIDVNALSFFPALVTPAPATMLTRFHALAFAEAARLALATQPLVARVAREM